MNKGFTKLMMGTYLALAVGSVAYASEGMITIDAGHGGNNSTAGKRAANGDFYEWDINDKVANVLEVLLREQGYTVERLDDVSGQTDVSINTRLARAKEKGSDLHISIHQNALDDIMWSNATGTETYYSNNGGWSIKQLAQDIAERMANYIGTFNRGAKGTTNELFITREFTRSGIDAILIEGLFMDNEQDVQTMQTDEYIESYAQAIFDGIVSTYGNIENKVAPITVQAQASTQVEVVKTTFKKDMLVRVKELGETLNIRRYPSRESQVVGEIQPSECFTIADVTENGEWGLLKAYESGRDGWVRLSEKYIEEVK